MLVYSTAAAAADMEVTGPVSLELYVQSSAADTDFTAKLVDVSPNGFAQNLTEGILRTRYRDSQEKPELLTPGETYKLPINVWSTSNVFKKGHVIRLEVSSSNFPRFNRISIPAKTTARASGSCRRRTRVSHDAQHPSTLTLPVVRLP